MRQPAPLEHLLGGGDRAGEHLDRVDTAEPEGVEPGTRLEPELVGAVLAHDEGR